MDEHTDGQMDVGHINLIGGLVTRNPPNKKAFILPLEVRNVKKTCRKSWAGNLFQV